MVLVGISNFLFLFKFKETLSSSEEQLGRKVSLQIPAQLLPILSSHIIQEAANEPYGLKGGSKVVVVGFKDN